MEQVFASITREYQAINNKHDALQRVVPEGTYNRFRVMHIYISSLALIKVLLLKISIIH